MKRILLTLLTAGSLMSANAAVFQYNVVFSDAGEALPSPGATGSGTVSYDDVAHSLTMVASFSGLMGTTSAAHIHAATASPFTGNAGVATQPTLVGFPFGVTSGSHSNTLDLTLASSFNTPFVTANGGTLASAEAALASAMATGRAYWNIHTSYASGGEIRGFLTAVPEPSSLAILGMGVLGFAMRVRRKRPSNSATN